jgi:hypothetical protein
MNHSEIVQAIDAEIDRLSKARTLLKDHTAPLKRGLPRSASKSRARMAAAQTARRKREKAKGK